MTCRGTSISKQLLEALADVNRRDVAKRSPLACAAASGSLSLCQAGFVGMSNQEVNGFGDGVGKEKSSKRPFKKMLYFFFALLVPCWGGGIWEMFGS